MKDLKTNLKGKIRNLPHFHGEALLPVFEAVINAIQAIEERGNLDTGKIGIQIVRDRQMNLNAGEEPPITGFVITDNGIGFDQGNFESFQTSDSVHKLAKGGKGIGRFLWLKAFDGVDIDSVFAVGEKRMRRKFRFSVETGIGDGDPVSTTGPQGTTIRLVGFKKEYRTLPSAYKTTAKIAQRIMEHCLSYFIAGGMPQISVQDTNDEVVHLNDIFDQDLKDNISSESITLNGHQFTLTHIKLYSTHDRMHNIVLCADRRDVQPISLARALGTSTQFDDSDRRFTYAQYVTSPYLDEHADHYRLDFDLPEEPILGEANIVSKTQVIDAASNAARTFLHNYLAEARTRKEERVAAYVAKENPALRAVPVYCPEVYDEIDPTSSPERIDEVLHHFKGKAEFEIRKRSADLLKTQANSLEEIEAAYGDLAAKITDFQKDNLANYLCDRKRIIALLERKLELNKGGTVPNENIVHDIIFPRKATSEQLRFEDHNLWLVDECIAFHSFAASDKPLSQTMESSSDERPDILAFAEVGEDRIARAVSVLEFKKPQRTSFDEDPTKQLYRYVREARRANIVKLPSGRNLQVTETTRFYCYAICDLVPSIKEYCENNNYATLMGELGYYSYNRNHNAHTEVLDFDKIVLDAKRRHKAFFDKLGIA